MNSTHKQFNIVPAVEKMQQYKSKSKGLIVLLSWHEFFLSLSLDQQSSLLPGFHLFSLISLIFRAQACYKQCHLLLLYLSIMIFSVTCSKPLIPGGTVSPSDANVEYSEVYEVTCNTGHTISGANTMTCEPNGTFDQTPNCQIGKINVFKFIQTEHQHWQSRDHMRHFPLSRLQLHTAT